MKKLIAAVIAVAMLSGCKALITPRGDITKIPKASTARFIHQSPAAIPAFVIPTNPLSITGIRESEGGFTISWNGGESVVNGSLYPNGPWSAIIRSYSPAEVPLPVPLREPYSSNRFYRVSQSSGNMERFFMGGFTICPMVGDNDITIASTDNHWSDQDYLFTLTNGTFTGFPLIAPGITPCSPLTMAVDTNTWRLFTVEAECYHGWNTGPYKLWEWQLVGGDGFFNDAEPVSSTTFNGHDLGSTWGDMIRLGSGGIVTCWRSPSSNYCFRYRSPAGVWQPIFCEKTIEQRVSTMTLAQHPNGDVYCYITRDGLPHIPAVIFRESNGKLVYLSTQNLMLQEGEWSETTAAPDHSNNRLIVTRAYSPSIFWKAGEAQQTVKGSCMRSAYWYSETNVVESPTFPDSRTNSSGWLDPVNHQDVFIFAEPVNRNATALSDGKLWLIKQEFNPNEERFNLVYAQTLENNVWGERHYLYKTPDCGECRGLARNWLTGFRNSSAHPKRILFTNVNEDGVAELFELTP